MNSLVENERKNNSTSLNDIKNLSFNSSLTKNNYNLKEQLEELIGPIDFTSRLEKVNLSIGIIVSAVVVLLLFL